MGIKRVGVVGGGTMGIGIARVVAGSGYPTWIVEKSDQSSLASSAALRQELSREVSRWVLTAAEREAILDRISMGSDLNVLAQVDILIEALPEDLETKKAVLAAAAGVCSESSVFVTNTATLSVSQLALATKRPEKFVGMHFMHPAPFTPVVEIVRGLATSRETVETVRAFAHKLGKTPIEVAEYPGFVTTRIIVPLINEAAHVVMEGIATPEDVDRAVQLGYGFEKGPLALADSMGLDVVMSWMDHLFHELGDSKYRACPLLRKMVRAGRLGEKAGHGFFLYGPKPQEDEFPRRNSP